MGALPQRKDYDLDKYLEVKGPSAKEIREKRKEREKALFIMRLVRCVMGIFMVVMIFSFIHIGMQVKINSLNREIAYMEEQIKTQKSESTRLEMELAKKFSPIEVEKYAKEHGMIKAETYQITYIDLSEGDRVVVSGGKEVPTEENSLWYKIKHFFKEGEW